MLTKTAQNIQFFEVTRKAYNMSLSPLRGYIFERSRMQTKVDIQIYDSLSRQAHFHQEVELIYVLEGEMTLCVMERKYHLTRGDICVINSNEEHSFESLRETTTAHIFIKYQLIRSVYNGVSSFFFCNSASEDDERYEELRELLINC